MSLAERTPRSEILWHGPTTVRARPWPDLPNRAALLITGSHGPDVTLPDRVELDHWMERLAESGFDSVRTSALSPEVASRFEQLGFHSVQELTLLRVLHRTPPTFQFPPSYEPRRVWRIPGRPYSPSVCSAILRVDHAAFGPAWCIDKDTFDESRTATERSRLFVQGDPTNPDGFIVVGATGRNGFIQRLAVDPTKSRQGIATHLLAAALRWTYKVGCSQTIVNTEVTNSSALALYKKFGFTPLPQGLSVMERDL